MNGQEGTGEKLSSVVFHIVTAAISHRISLFTSIKRIKEDLRKEADSGNVDG